MKHFRLGIPVTAKLLSFTNVCRDVHDGCLDMLVLHTLDWADCVNIPDGDPDQNLMICYFAVSVLP